MLWFVCSFWNIGRNYDERFYLIFGWKGRCYYVECWGNFECNKVFCDKSVCYVGDDDCYVKFEIWVVVRMVNFFFNFLIFLL